MKTLTMFSIGLSMILTTLFLSMNEMQKKKKDKKSPFECGFQPLSEKKTTFSTNFIMLMMMFLIFDVEISVLIPFLLMNKNNNNTMTLLSSIFITTLALLTMKEWKQGSLEWTK